MVFCVHWDLNAHGRFDGMRLGVVGTAAIFTSFNISAHNSDSEEADEGSFSSSESRQGRGTGHGPIEATLSNLPS